MDYARVDRAVRQCPFFFLLGFDEGVALSPDATPALVHVSDAPIFGVVDLCDFGGRGGEWSPRYVCHPLVTVYFDRIGVDVWHDRTAPVDASVANQSLC